MTTTTLPCCRKLVPTDFRYGAPSLGLASDAKKCSAHGLCRSASVHGANGVSHATNAEVNEHRRLSDVRRTDGRTDDGRTTDRRRTKKIQTKKFRQKNSDEKIPTKKFRRKNSDEKIWTQKNWGQGTGARHGRCGGKAQVINGDSWGANPPRPPGGARHG